MPLLNSALKDSESSFTPVLDGLVALARTGMNVGDPRTYITAYDYLERAMVLLGVKDESNSPLPRLANHIRCLSGAFHNAAGALYQAGKYGSAIGFLKDGCRLGSVALTMWKSSKTPSKEGWKQLGDQLHRRWQLLAVCYTKIEDRKVEDCLISEDRLTNLHASWHSKRIYSASRPSLMWKLVLST